MKKFFNSLTITTGLGIFSMFFGAGNLMYPLNVGLFAGDRQLIAILSFMITAIILPTLGLTSIVLFNGDYKAFFNRLGKVPGTLVTLACVLIIGPLIAMPRIVTLSYEMVSPFLPSISLPIFSVLFLCLTLLFTFKERRIMDILGKVISPILLIALLIIIIKGLITGHYSTSTDLPTTTLILQNIKYGYKTLDMLGAIFFASIVLSILKKNFVHNNSRTDQQRIAWLTLKAGALGTSLLGIIYMGLSYLGACFGTGLNAINEGELFSKISFRILGDHGALIISTAVIMACLSTIIPLSAVAAEYVHSLLLKERINYKICLIGILGVTLFISNFGLSAILRFSAPIIEVCYPMVIVLMFCNIAYKIFGFKPVKIPVFITFIISLFAYLR